MARRSELDRFKEYLQHSNKRYTNNTINGYVNTAKRILDIIDEDDLSIRGLTRKRSLIVDYCNSNKNNYKPKQILMIITYYLEFADRDKESDIYNYYRALFQKYSRVDNDRRAFADATEDENKKYISWDTVIENAERTRELYNASPSMSRLKDYVIATLYTQIPPLRQNEYVTLSWTNRDDNNYLDLQNKQIVLRDFKTSGTYGENVIKIPEEVMEVLRIYRRRINILAKIPDNVFNLTPRQFGTRLKRALGATSQMLRKIYVSEVSMKKSKQGIKDDARIMSHSLAMHLLEYDKF